REPADRPGLRAARPEGAYRVSAALVETVLPPSESVGRQTWRAFVRNPLGVASLAVLLLLGLVALAAPLIAHYPAGYGDDVLIGPGGRHWFGTDDLGRDVFAQVIWGTRVSILVCLLASLLAIALGVLVGVAAAYFKSLDALLGMVVDLSL